MKKLIALFALVLALSCRKAEHARVASLDEARAKPIQLNQQQSQVQGAAQPQTQAQRMIVRTADVRITVADTTKAVAAITQTVEASGGYVSGSHLWRDGELMRAKLVLRVPSDKLTSTLSAIRGVAKRVESETISSEEVTQEYVDLEAQLRNLEATEIELRELMTGIRKNARKAIEVLEIHQQVTNIRGEIERVRGRMRYLGQVASMSQISLDIAPDVILQPVVEPGWRPLVIVRDASRALVGVLQSVATAGIWIVIYVTPIATMFLLVALLFWKVYRRSRERAPELL